MTATELRALRERLGLTQAALAARLGTAQGRVSDWENERRPIPLHAEAHLRTLEALHRCEQRLATGRKGTLRESMDRDPEVRAAYEKMAEAWRELGRALAEQ